MRTILALAIVLASAFAAQAEEAVTPSAPAPLLFALPPQLAAPAPKIDDYDTGALTEPGDSSMFSKMKGLLDLGPNVRLTAQSHNEVMPEKDTEHRDKGTYVNLKFNW